jgi:hypothetical protein
MLENKFFRIKIRLLKLVVTKLLKRFASVRLSKEFREGNKSIVPLKPTYTTPDKNLNTARISPAKLVR